MDIKDLQDLHQTLPLTGNTTPRTFQLQIPVDGSLELLALGDIGLLAWRAAKNRFIESQSVIINPEQQ